jgi:Fic family protein
MVLRGLTIDKKPLREHFEVTQHRDAFKYVCDMVAKKEPLDEKIIKNIHSIVLNDRPAERGVYRNIAVHIIGATHIPPNPLKVPMLMQELITEYAKGEKNVIKNIAVFHIQFECIHPFIDGNGRTGRLLANLELMKAGYPPVDIKFTDRKDYYDSLSDYDTNGSTEKFEMMFAGYVLERIEENLKVIG